VGEPAVEQGWAADADAAAHLIVDGALDDDLIVEGRDGHHLERVRRLRTEERVTVADGFGTWRPYVVADTARGRLTLTSSGAARREPRLEPALSVAFALTKGEKPEVVVARLTELGVDRIVPVEAARSVVSWRGDRADAAVARLARVAREASMQCRRARVPHIEPMRLSVLAGRPGLVIADRVGVDAGRLPPPGPDGWLLVVGPEGGLDPDELDRLVGPRLAVGPHVLRAETAAIAAAAALTGQRAPAGHHGG